MILLVGACTDPVIARLERLLRQHGAGTARIEEDRPARYELDGAAGPAGRAPWRIRGGDCTGERAVGAVFIRRGPAGHGRRSRQARWQSRLDRLLLGAGCPVVNPPMAACGNYPKVHQLFELAGAGLPVPPTLLTGAPIPAMQFLVEHRGQVLVKGLSSVRSLPAVVGQSHLAKLEQLRACPAQFQRIAEGQDIRLTVIGSEAIASLPAASGAYRNTAAATILPLDVVKRCTEFVRAQGLVMGGFDLRLQEGGAACFFEMNPNPLITHYETDAEPTLSLRLCHELLMRSAPGGDILV